MSHSIKKVLLYTIIVCVSLVLAYMLFSKSETNKSKLARNESQARNSYTNGRDALVSEKSEGSLFDANNGFLEFSDKESEESAISDKAYEYDPARISPEERARRKKLAIEKYKPLAELFPKNRYIPREKTDKELAKEKRRNEIMDSLQDRIITGEELTSDESLFFYSEKKQELAEKLEILNYAKEKLNINPNTNSVTNDILTKRFESIQSRNEAYSKEIDSAKEKGGDLKNFSEE
ncbi:MAG: hypothetical protein O9346_07580 [Leptospiraceae bacterium]|nr:hypothetical protein [Leptospiraceae bacterium]MCZ8346259.1 hypothetical protein [Leptospiraceae bacterium]